MAVKDDITTSSTDERGRALKLAIEKIEKRYAGNGRVLIRTSGTEPLVRVMIEGSNLQLITEYASAIAALIELRLG